MATSSLPTGVSGDLLVQVRDSYASRYPGASRKTIEYRARRVVTDTVVLARAAKGRQLVTYEQTQLLRVVDLDRLHRIVSPSHHRQVEEIRLPQHEGEKDECGRRNATPQRAMVRQHGRLEAR